MYIYIYRDADKSLAWPDRKSNWKVAIFRPTRRSLLPRRPGWMDNLNFFWGACKSWNLVSVACFLPGRIRTYQQYIYEPSHEATELKFHITYCHLQKIIYYKNIQWMDRILHASIVPELSACSDLQKTEIQMGTAYEQP
jgi:hypothetical protein